MLEQLLEVSPRDIPALVELADLYQKQKRWASVVSTLERLADALARPAERAEVWRRIATLQRDRLADPTQALAAWRRVIELDPADREAIETVRRECQARRDWSGLLELDRRELDRIADPRARAARCVELAGHADRLDRPDQAIELWSQALELDPSRTEPLAELERRCPAAGRWDALASAHACCAAAAAGPEQQARHLEAIARLAGERLADPQRAIATWRELLELIPDHAGAVDGLGELLAAAGEHDQLEALLTEHRRWDQLVAALRRRAGDEPTPHQLLRIAEIERDRLGRPDQAARSYQQVLALDPDNQTAAEALIPHYRSLGVPGPLAAVLEVSVRHTADPRLRIERLLELAGLQLRLGLPDRARATHHQVLVVDPGEPAALAALAGADPPGVAARPPAVEVRARIYREGEHWAALADLLAHSTPESAAQRADRMLELAELRARRLGEREAAVAALHDAHAAAELLAEPEQLAFWLRLVAVAAGLGETAAADAAAGRAAEIDSDDPEQLEQLAAACRTARRWGRLAAVTRRIAALEPDPERRSELLVETGAAIEPDADPEIALDLYREARRVDPRSQTASSAILRLLRARCTPGSAATDGSRRPSPVETGCWQELADALRRHAALADRPAEAIATLGELAELELARLDDPVAAIATCGEILDLDPSATTALRIRAEAYRRAGLTSQELQLLERQFERNPDPEERAALADQMAAIYEHRLERFDLAAELLHRAQRLAPAPDRFRRLVDLYQKLHRLDAVTALLREEMAAAEDRNNRIERGFELARLLERTEGDSAAIAAYRELLEIDPDHAGAWSALASIHERGGAWSRATECLRRLCQIAPTRTERARAHHRLALLLGRDDRNASAVQLEQALAADPGHLPALLDLAALWRPDRPDRAARILADGARHADAPADRARLLRESGEILSRDLGDHDRAARLYARALDVDPEQIEAGLALVALCEQAQRQQELWHVLTLLERRIDPDDRTAHHAIQFKLARAGEALGLYRDALVHYEAAWRLDPTDVPTLVALTDLRRRLEHGSD